VSGHSGAAAARNLLDAATGNAYVTGKAMANGIVKFLLALLAMLTGVTAAHATRADAAPPSAAETGCTRAEAAPAAQAVLVLTSSFAGYLAAPVIHIDPAQAAFPPSLAATMPIPQRVCRSDRARE